MTAWNGCVAWEYTSTQRQTHTHRIGSRHMRQSVSQPAVLTICMLKIVTHVGGWRAPRYKITARLCVEAAEQSHACIQPSSKREEKKTQCLRMVVPFGADRVPRQSADQHSSIKLTVFGTWLHVAHFSSLDMLITPLILHESTALPRANTETAFKTLSNLMGEPWPQRWSTYQTNADQSSDKEPHVDSCDTEVTSSTPRPRPLIPCHLGPFCVDLACSPRVRVASPQVLPPCSHSSKTCRLLTVCLWGPAVNWWLVTSLFTLNQLGFAPLRPPNPECRTS